MSRSDVAGCPWTWWSADTGKLFVCQTTNEMIDRRFPAHESRGGASRSAMRISFQVPAMAVSRPQVDTPNRWGIEQSARRTATYGERFPIEHYPGAMSPMSPSRRR